MKFREQNGKYLQTLIAGVTLTSRWVISKSFDQFKAHANEQYENGENEEDGEGNPVIDESGNVKPKQVYKLFPDITGIGRDAFLKDAYESCKRDVKDADDMLAAKQSVSATPPPEEKPPGGSKRTQATSN